ncbi:NAD-dependent epimerase/dehydratase family protein [Flavobacterium johnsoniae]|jgi:nucleoside-diphosphate-sugar epimerase|uniref:NAD-dependent epimerase/dehydratase n=1 Tax=Flavobacterium johnsoniae (strain ATCC 17061 / DSM 2064 / JCM 8514 / BCRC 14874 / CCUG 350202 / NBRC 14942 / NCIMB 11054 / UW101) TaxID=376686 RepID=A5FN52_FLAJ1|nr:NAD-dependent epimerase/dehydratase family protein [Flavobacterium johnsoniae]ABQ03373.1 NAD-dependent epimerase/dehydratase [Flavobacterium johnsoniae UW101]OXG01211.1 nucleoside-diphosphate-sugar epimerase [Flavobacterium johnsoniae UW101]WQG79762.1 NAD-dependent epimerase/dehydratase family protein [Flavobacterium johnsoniae UW101]SHL77096.1 Nucleoside-diphosphate-sugar epimerase [Flavobacterium johnsoniae]
MNRILITGSTGFVGSYLQDYFKSYYELDILSVRYKKEQQFEILSEAIIHLAGKAHDLKKVSTPQDYYEANFELTKQLFDAFLTSESSVFVFMSTVKAASDEVKGILKEDVIPNPKTHYGISKHQAEEYILNKKLPQGKRVYILRPCMIHGDGNKGNLNLLYQLVSKGFPWPLGAFENQRSFLSIENLCFIVKELLENQSIPSGIYNVADDKSLSTNELIELLGESLNKKVHILNLSKDIIKSLVKFGDFLHLPLNSERLQKLTENYLVSNEKIINAIGKSLPVSAEEGLKRTFASFRN